MQKEIDKVVDLRDNKKSVSESPRSPCGWVAKLKSIKHIEVIISIIVIAVMLLCFGVISGKGNKKEVATSTTPDTLAIELQDILSDIKGVGSAKVLIVFNGGNKLEIASKVDKETNTVTDDGRVTSVENESSSPVIVGGKPLVLSEHRGEIDGVIVVADGGGNKDIRQKLTRAISSLLHLNSSKIQIFEKK